MEKNYSELDKELERLRSDLEIQDEMTNRFTSPVSTNYWQRRLEEEKELWRKRMLAKEEEKKILEAKIKRQDMNLTEYQSKLAEIEKTFERELKNWEERFRVKEADLLLEKNRLLWEEKVKDAESETRQLLEKINFLNETIARLKDENLADKEKMLANFEEEKRTLNGRINSVQGALDNLNAHLAEVKNLSAAQEEKLRAEIVSKNSEMETLYSERAALVAERNSLQKEIERLAAAFADERAAAEKKRFSDISALVGKLSSKISALAKTAEYRRKMKLPAGEEAAIFVEETAAILEALSSGGAPAGAPRLPEPIALLGDIKFLEPAAAEMKNVEPVAVSRAGDIPAVAPAALLSTVAGPAVSAAKKYPFLPVILAASGPIKIKTPPANLRLIHMDRAGSLVDLIREADAAVSSGIARKELWSGLVPRKNYSVPAVAAALAFAVAAAAYFIPARREAVREFAVPYSLPTAVALDTSYLWSCDWQGGAIYQHELDSKLTLRKISYFPENNFSAIAFAGGAVYTANPWRKKINKHILDEKFSIAREYSVRGVSVGALAFVGPKLYVSGAQKNIIYEGYLDDTSGEFVVVREIRAPGVATAGLWYDGEKLWSCDAADSKVYCHIPDENLTVAKAYMLPESYRKNFRISGFSGRRGELWISSERMGKIIAVPLSRLIPLKSVALKTPSSPAIVSSAVMPSPNLPAPQIEPPDADNVQ